MTPPKVLNYGMGVDSTAAVVGATARGIRFDLILFADTGGEKAATYAYLPVINAWLRAHDQPEVTVVRYRPERVKYTTLEENCLTNQTLPSIAFPRGGGPGTGGCSLKWKAGVMRSFLLGARRGPWKGPGWEPHAAARAAGKKTIRYVGYDDGTRDRLRAEKGGAGDKRDAANFVFVYPLQEWGWDRDRCQEEIVAAGLPLPPKSACFYCPASKKHEILQLALDEPTKLLRAVAMEDNARDGKHGLDAKRGLGIRFRWRDFLETEGVLAPGGSAVELDAERIAARAAELGAQSEIVRIQRKKAA